MFLKLHIKNPDKHREKESNQSTVLRKWLYKIITNISDKQVWNALVAREKQEYEASTHWDHSYLKPENNPAWMNVQTQTAKKKKRKKPTDCYSKITTAPQRGRSGEQRRRREQQEQTYTLIKGESLKISWETVLFLVWSKQKYSVPWDFAADTTVKKGFVPLIIWCTIIVGVKIVTSNNLL